MNKSQTEESNDSSRNSLLTAVSINENEPTNDNELLTVDNNAKPKATTPLLSASSSSLSRDVVKMTMIERGAGEMIG